MVTAHNDVNGTRYTLRLGKLRQRLALRIGDHVMVDHDHVATQGPIPPLQRRDQDGTVLVQRRDQTARAILSAGAIGTTEVWAGVAITSGGPLVVDIDMVIVARHNTIVVVVVMTVRRPPLVDVNVVVIT